MDFDTEINSFFTSSSQNIQSYILSDEQSSMLQRKNEIYNELTRKFPVSLGKKASKSERLTRDKLRDCSLTYGEIEFISLGEIFYTINERYGGLPQGGIFYDLGSGIGKAIIAAALLGSFTECYGIEILNSLYDISIQLIEEYNNEINQELLKNTHLWTTLPRINNIQGNILDGT